MPASLDVSITPSRYSLVLLLSIAALACACVFWSHLPSLLTLVLTALILASSVAALRRHYFLRAPDSIDALSYRQEAWFLQIQDQELAATLLPSSTVTSLFLVLNFRLAGSGRKANLVLLPDSAAAQSLRQLKAVTRLSKLRRSSFPAAE